MNAAAKKTVLQVLVIAAAVGLAAYAWQSGRLRFQIQVDSQRRYGADYSAYNEAMY